MKRILIVDDEPDIRLGLKLVLERAGYAITAASDGKEGLRLFYDARPDLVVLDVGMPEMDGWQTLARLRELSDVPVLMLTARGLEQEKVRGLQAGADDYQTKPYGTAELLARIEALLRRAEVRGAAGADAPREVYRDAHVTVDFAAHAVTGGVGRVELSPLEFRMLDCFVSHPGVVLSHHQILDRVWGDVAAVDRGEVKTYVRYLRRKLGWDDSGPIASVRGVGYAYRPAA